MARQPLAAFRQHRLRYEHDPAQGSFRHNFDRDLHLFVLWERARPHEQAILADLAEVFEIRHCAEIRWSPTHAEANFKRLYRRPDATTSRKPEQVGVGAFLCVVVEDPDPVYVVGRSASGRVEHHNRAVERRKARYRGWAGGEFRVHATNSPAEFFHQAPLLLGPARVRGIVAGDGWSGAVEPLTRDLAGADGWEGFEDLFAVLELTSNFVVLRNFEALPHDFFGNERDIDVLADGLEGVVSAANATLRDGPDRPGARVVRVAGRPVPLDVQVVGDGSLDARWQLDMLWRQSVHAGRVPCPRADDHFFALLYHAKLQKRALKPADEQRLPALAQAIGLELSPRDLRSDRLSAALLTGFMQAAGYRYVEPRDPGAVVNRAMAGLMGDVREPRPGRSLRRRLGRALARAAPAWLTRLVPQRARARLRWFLRI